MTALKDEMEEAARERNEALRAKLAEEHTELEKKMALPESDRKRLENMVVDERSRFEEGLKKAEQDHLDMEHRNAEMQARLQEAQQKAEAEVA